MLQSKLKELRESKGYTQAKVAELIGVSRVAYGLHETGKRQMSFEALTKLADFYDVTIDYLLNHRAAGMIVLTDEEKRMLTQFRGLDPRGRQTVQVLIDYEANR